MSTELVCPKCQGVMRSYERNQVTIDQCTECRGIFLDRGELERLMDAESTFNQRQPSPERPQPGPPAYQSGGHHGSTGGHDGRTKRRKSFLGELFD